MSRVLPYSYAVYIWEMFVCLVLLFGYNVRKEEDWKKLFMEAGFQSYKISPFTGYLSLIEIYP